MAIDYSFTSKPIEELLYGDTLTVYGTTTTTYPCHFSFNESSSSSDSTSFHGVNNYSVNIEVTCPVRTVVTKGQKVGVTKGGISYTGIASAVNVYDNHKTLYYTYTTPDTDSTVDTEDY